MGLPLYLPRKDLSSPIVRQNAEAVQRWAEALPFFQGEGSPEGVVQAGVGALYLRSDGGAGTTLYIKETGTGSTGWDAK